LMLPGQAFSHTTALTLYGVPVPDEFQHQVHVSVRFPRTPPRAAGTRGHSLRVLEVSLRDALPIATPAGSWCQAAAILSREDLVAAGDALVTGPRTFGGRLPAVSTLELLGAEAARHSGSPGAGRMQWALPHVRSGAESRPESLLRLLVVSRRLPEPLIAVPIMTSIGLLHADLGYLAEKVAIEYEGDQHRTDRVRWKRDIRRREAMEDAGWRVIRVTSDDLFLDPGGLALRIRHILKSRAVSSLRARRVTNSHESRGLVARGCSAKLDPTHPGFGWGDDTN